MGANVRVRRLSNRIFMSREIFEVRADNRVHVQVGEGISRGASFSSEIMKLATRHPRQHVSDDLIVS